MKKLFIMTCMAVASVASADTIAYWPFGTNGFHDVSGNGHDLTSATVTESDAGYITLNGTSQFLQTVAALNLSSETAVTFECWTRMTAENKSFPLLFCSANPTSGTGGFVLYYGKDQHVFQAQYRMTTSSWQLERSALTSQLQDNAWHHVAYVVDRSKTGWDSVRLYVDGVEQLSNGGVQGVVPALFNDTFMIGGGANYASGNNFYTGYIDDVRISRGVLTPDEFLKYPTVGKAMNAESSALPVVAYWPFGANGATDVSGNGFDLVTTSVPMASGASTPSWDNYVNTCKTSVAIPFSAFSKTGLTIECYAKSGSGSSDPGYLFESTTDYSANLGAFCLRYEAGFKTIGAYFRSATGKLDGGRTTEETLGDLNDQHWRHIAFVYDPSKTGEDIATLYIDGVAAPTAPVEAAQKPFVLADAVLHLMRRSSGSSRLYNFYGAFDDARITAGVLTPDQFLAARSDKSGSLVALYRFDRETLADQSGNGNDLEHWQGDAVANTPTFGKGNYNASGTGLIFTGNNGDKDWMKTSSTLDLSDTKAVTLEIDYNSETPSANYFLVGSENPLSANGNVAYLDKDRYVHGQTRNATGGAWRNIPGPTKVGASTNGYQRVRYVVNGNNAGTSYYTLNVDGTAKSVNDTLAISDLGNQALCLGHSPNYVQSYWMAGKILRVAVSKAALASADFVLDNLVLDTEKQTLAYWDFVGSTDKSGNGHDLTASVTARRRGAIALNGSGAATTTLALSGLTQATIECFVLLGETPASGTLFSMGTGAGSFAVAADATSGTLSGTFVPYLNSAGLASLNGGQTALAPLAGRKAWHHVALVIDGTKQGADAVRFYVDYQRATPAGRAWDNAARPLDGTFVIGANSTQKGGFFTGSIDDVRVSAGALEPEEFIQSSERTEIPDGIIISFF